VEKKETSYTAGVNVKMNPHILLWKAIWRLLKKLITELPYNLAIPLLGIYLKECESAYNKASAHFYCSTIHNCCGDEVGN
jgi:hypothetical protein